jgi:hypothetical protein
MSNIFQNKEGTKWKILSFSLIVILIGSTTTTAVFFRIPQQVLNGPLTGQQLVNAPSIINAAYGAGVLTNVFALPADNIFSAKTYYTIAFTPTTTGAFRETETIGEIEMTFPAGFNVASAKLLEVQGIREGYLSVVGQTIKYTIFSPMDFPAQRPIKISIADIINGATTSNQVSVTTKAISGANRVILDGPTNSATFTLVQVSNAMLASNAVTGSKITANSMDTSKIIDGSLIRADLSTSFMKKNVIADCDTCNTGGWTPNGLSRVFYKIIEPAVVHSSVVTVTTDTLAPDSCAAFITVPGSFNVACKDPVSNGARLNYVVIN